MRVAQPAREDAPHAGDPAGQRLHDVGGGPLLAEHHHIGVDPLDRLVLEQHRRQVVEGRGHPGVRQQGGCLLGGAALLRDEREGALLVEAERVDAVHHDLAGQLLAEGGEGGGVPVPGHRHDDDVALTGGGGVVRAAHPEADRVRRGLRAGRVARTDDHLLAGLGQPQGQPPPLVAGAAEDTDHQLRDVRQLMGRVCR